MSEEEKGYEVTDKRRTTTDDARPADTGTTEPGPTDESEQQPDDDGRIYPYDFISFIGSLGGSAVMHMGERLAPDQPEVVTNLPAARQMVDILGMLQEKTKGNLSDQEAGALENLLYNIRMLYVKKLGKG